MCDDSRGATRRHPTRRRVLAQGAAMLGVAAVSPPPAPGVDALRLRIEFIDALLVRARDAHSEGRFDRVAYLAILRWLRDEELVIHAAAAARTYSDITESNYWHRSRLKFPTVTQQELERMERQP